MNLPSLAANTVLAGPASGTAPAPVAARALVTADLPAIPTLITGRLTGGYYTKDFGGALSAGLVTLDTLYAFPFVVGDSQSFDRIAAACLAVASSFIRLGIYGDTNGKPDALILDAGQVSCAAAGVKEVSISQTLSGVVWLAAVGQGVAPQMTRFPTHNDTRVGNASPYSTGLAFAYSQGSVSGALPSPWGSTYTATGAPAVVTAVYLRKG